MEKGRVFGARREAERLHGELNKEFDIHALLSTKGGTEIKKRLSEVHRKGIGPFDQPTRE